MQEDEVFAELILELNCKLLAGLAVPSVGAYQSARNESRILIAPVVIWEQEL